MRDQVAENPKTYLRFERFVSASVNAVSPSEVEGRVVDQSKKSPRADQAERSGFAVRKQRDQQRIRQAAMRTNSVAKLFCASTYTGKLRPHRS